MKILKKIYTYFLTHLLPDSIYLKYAYWRKTRKYLNLDNPKTLNEKIQWLKLNDRDADYTIYADKYRVRTFVKDLIGEKYLIPLLCVFKDEKAISLSELPAEPFIIKTNHDSTGGLIFRNKSLVNIDKIRKDLKNKLSRNHYYLTKEYQYKDIEKCIIVEKLLIDKNNKIPNDYKFHCFHGKVAFIYVSIDREGANYRKIYTSTWKAIDVSWCPLGEGNSKFSGPDIEKPLNLSEMIDLAETLSQRFRYVRIDLYNVDGQIYFGEVTQHQGGGFEVITPLKYDEKWGSMLLLDDDD